MIRIQAVQINGLADNGIYSGVANRVAHLGENPNLFKIIGGENSLQFNSTIAGTTVVVNAEALRARISNSGTFARDYDLTTDSFSNGLIGIGIRYAFNDTSGGRTITATHIKGIDIDAPSGTSLSVVNSTGIWIDQQTAGTTDNYGIVLAGYGYGADIVFGQNQEARIYSSTEDSPSTDIGIWVEDGTGNTTRISPHDPKTGEWIFQVPLSFFSLCACLRSYEKSTITWGAYCSPQTALLTQSCLDLHM